MFFGGFTSDIPDSITTDGPRTNGNGSNSGPIGTFWLLISDQPVAIDEFDSLNVTFDYARIVQASDDDEDEGGENDENETDTDDDDEDE